MSQVRWQIVSQLQTSGGDALLAKMLYVRGTMHLLSAADRGRCRPLSATRSMSSAKYAGARLDKLDMWHDKVLFIMTGALGIQLCSPLVPG